MIVMTDNIGPRTSDLRLRPNVIVGQISFDHTHINLFCVSLHIHSSDVVWELKPKKKNRWKTMSTKEAEMLENSFKMYTESGPVDNAIVDLDNNFQVRDYILNIQLP